ncbi:Uncharacterized protein FWK35_00014199, partial [Aphis craccivora]
MEIKNMFYEIRPAEGIKINVPGNYIPDRLGIITLSNSLDHYRIRKREDRPLLLPKSEIMRPIKDQELRTRNSRKQIRQQITVEEDNLQYVNLSDFKEKESQLVAPRPSNQKAWTQQLKPSLYNKPNGIPCFQCGDGHYARDCDSTPASRVK